MGIHPKINRWVEEFLNNITFRVKLGEHHSSVGAVKSGVPQGSVLVPLPLTQLKKPLANISFPIRAQWQVKALIFT